MPAKVRYRKETYRVNKKTPARIASRFGTITLHSFYYLNVEDGEPGLHPLWLRLGIGAGAATPALLERVGACRWTIRRPRCATGCCMNMA